MRHREPQGDPGTERIADDVSRRRGQATEDGSEIVGGVLDGRALGVVGDARPAVPGRSTTIAVAGAVRLERPDRSTGLKSAGGSAGAPASAGLSRSAKSTPVPRVETASDFWGSSSNLPCLLRKQRFGLLPGMWKVAT